MVHVKSKRELDAMRRVGSMVSEVLQTLVDSIKPGITLLELDEMAERKAIALGAKPAFKGYCGYQHALCTSVNDAIVHGVPSTRVLKDGDIIGLDFGLIFDGFFGDSAITVPVGTIDDSTRTLLAATLRSLYAAIRSARPGNTLKDIAKAVEGQVLPHGFSIVREFVGHGIGRKLHEDPQIPNYAAGASNLALKAGMTVCIEPMINAGSAGVRVLDDKWTAVTHDGSFSAHYEHSIAILEDRTEILTEWGESPYGGILEKLGVLEPGEGINV